MYTSNNGNIVLNNHYFALNFYYVHLSLVCEMVLLTLMTKHDWLSENFGTKSEFYCKFLIIHEQKKDKYLLCFLCMKINLNQIL